MSRERPTYAELARETLLRMMEDISEDFWCAGRLDDLEFIVWDALTTGSQFGRKLLDESERARMQFLHELAGGWWIFAKDEESRRFVNTNEWMAILAAHLRAQTDESNCRQEAGNPDKQAGLTTPKRIENVFEKWRGAGVEGIAPEPESVKAFKHESLGDDESDARLG